MIALEAAPNKYLENAFVLVKTWATLQMAISGAALLTFKSKLPSPSTINWALTLVKQDKKTPWQRLVRKVYTAQPILIVAVALLVGQWLIMIAYTFFLACMFNIRPAATDYLKGMHIDLDKKAAVIDV